MTRTYTWAAKARAMRRRTGRRRPMHAAAWLRWFDRKRREAGL